MRRTSHSACSRRDYEILARCLGQEFIMQRLEQRDTTAIEGTIQRVATALACDNLRFDKSKFMEALYASSKANIR
jgi:hypothetical protein